VTDWRIDELAQRAGIAVDTIRYYQREGLLPSGERAGRTRLYGPQHLERLERIRALQSRRFSLAAIGALLDREVPGAFADLIAGPEGATYAFDELVDAAGVSSELARALADVGLLPAPTALGYRDYDADDLNALRTFADLHDLAVPDTVLVELARLFAEGTERIQSELASVFAGTTGPPWTAAERKHFELAGEAAGTAIRLVRDVRAIADYAQQRNIERLIVQAIEVKAAALDHDPPVSDATT
jgi:DNA-binding transcriptional MerR regulator